MTFSPNTTAQIKSILWKFGKDKVVEFDPAFSPSPETYGRFQNRAHLNVSTGMLNITNLTTEDSGTYSVEINNILQRETYNLEVIGK